MAGHRAVQAFIDAAETLVTRDGFAASSMLIGERLRELCQDFDILEAELAS